MRARAIVVAGAATLLSGCAAKTVFDLATAPVRTGFDAADKVGKTYDLLTTSQSESDEKRGRAIRQREEKLGKLERRYRRQSEDCAEGDNDACRDQRVTWDEMEALRYGS